MNNTSLHGIIPAVITPMSSDGTIDTAMAERQIEYLAAAGANGLFINGTTGEGAYLTPPERRDMLKLARSVAGDRLFICGAVLRPNLTEVLDEIGELKRNGADYAVAVPPFYYPVDQSVVEDHFRRIAEASPLPLILYNIPGCTGNRLELATVRALKTHPNVTGVKDSSGDLAAFSRGLLADEEDGFVWIQGEDYLDAASLLIGAGGIVTGLGNVMVEPYIEMYAAAMRGDVAAVLKSQRRVNLLYEELKVAGYDVIPFIKAACELLDRGRRYMRQPGMALNTTAYREVEDALGRIGYL